MLVTLKNTENFSMMCLPNMMKLSLPAYFPRLRLTFNMFMASKKSSSLFSMLWIQLKDNKYLKLILTFPGHQLFQTSSISVKTNRSLCSAGRPVWIIQVSLIQLPHIPQHCGLHKALRCPGREMSFHKGLHPKCSSPIP